MTDSGMTKVPQMNHDDQGGRRRIHLREISGDSETALETVGQDLRAARLRRGDDLATVSRSLKIRKDHLEAVEEDNFSGLPGKTYAIGFVRTYAGYLGLDSAKTVERYKLEISSRHDEPLSANPNFHNDESRRLTYGWRIVAAVIGLALIYGVWHLVSAGPAPLAVPPAPALTPSRSRVVAVKPAPAPPPAATGNSAMPPTAVASLPAAPANPQSAVSSSIAAAPTKATALPSPAIAAVPSGPGEVYGRSNANPRVVLRTRGDTRLTVRGADGTIYLNRDLKPGDSYLVPNVAGLSLAASDGGAVDVSVDGKNLGKVGQDQQILGQVSLSPASLVDRFNSH
jgi:cytoskeleton protein RodZ